MEFAAHIEDTKLPKCVMYGELVGVRAACGVRKRTDEMSPVRPRSFRCQRRPVDDCSLGREGMTQDGGARGVTFHGKPNHCRES